MIEAYRFENKVCQMDTRPTWLMEAVADGTVRFHDVREGAPHHLIIKTLEGDHRADDGDWIIRGVHGELYPCKPEIFAKTYESAD